MAMNLVHIPKNETPEILAENLLDLAIDGQIKCVVMVIQSQDGSLRFEWSAMANNLAAIGMVEMLKQKLVEL